MIEIQRVGSFSRGKHHSKRYFLKHAVNRNCKHGEKYLVNYFLRMAVLLSLLVVLTAELNLQHLNVTITSSLKLSGDAELNRGPYQIIRSVQGSFNQGNVALFWGKLQVESVLAMYYFQFACQLSVIYAAGKSVDLDYILVEGDKLYKSLKCGS